MLKSYLKSWPCKSFPFALGVLLIGEGLLAHPVRSQITRSTPPTLWGLPARCAAISRSSLPQDVAYPDQAPRNMGDALMQFTLAGQYGTAIDLLQSLSAREQEYVMQQFPAFFRQVLRSGTAADRAIVQKYALGLFENLTEKELFGRWMLLYALVEIAFQEQQVDQVVPLSSRVAKLSQQLLPDPISRQEFLMQVIQSYYMTGLEAETLQIVDASDNAIVRALMRQEFAQQAIQQGRVDRAKVLLTQALSMLPPTAQTEYKVGLLIDLASLPDVPPDQVQTWLADVTPLMQKLPDKTAKATWLIQLAHLQQRLGQTQTADQSLRQMITIAQKLVSQDPNSLASLAKVALTEKQGTAADELLALALKLKSEADRTRGDFARHYANAGLIDRALEISNPISNEFFRESVQFDIAISALRLGRTEQAFALANRFKSFAPDQRRFAEQAAIYFLKTGQKQAALKLIQQYQEGFDILLVLMMQREKQAENLDWLLEQATRLANTLPNPQKQQALKQLASQSIELHRYDQALALQATVKDPALIKELNRDILRLLEKDIPPAREAQAFQFLSTQPDPSFRVEVWLKVMGAYANRGRKLPVFPPAQQVAQWLKGDRDKQDRWFDAYRKLQAFEPMLELVEVLKPGLDPWAYHMLRLNVLLGMGNLAAAQQELPPLRQLSEQPINRPQQQPPDHLLDQIFALTMLAPYYAESGDQAQALELLARAVKLQQQPAFRQVPPKQQNYLVAETVDAYARVAHTAAVANKQDMAQQAITQGKAHLLRLQPYRPDVTAAQTLECVRSTYALK